MAKRDPIRRCSMKRPSILKQLKNIMREYPGDVQILHELVQNADDAKASVMKIMFDQRQINPPGELGQVLKSPALCIYNDGVFDEDDWDGIKSVCLSHKEKKTDKIGRFGQGFKSVFHLTDTPVVVSGNTLLMINPLNVERECGMVFLSEIEDISNTGIFESFDFGSNAIRNNHYPATLFWFPLRSQESDLSKNVFTAVEMTKMLSLFGEDAAIVLLFLKYLTKIEIHNPTELSNPFINIKITYAQKKRSELQSFWSSMAKSTETKNKTKETFSIVIDAETQTQISTNSFVEIDHWTICHYHACHSDMSVELRQLAIDKEVACRVFNFLPLPATCKTYLPVHINGNFALSQNRRHLKLSDGRSADKFIKWNEGLIKEVLSESYITLVDHLIKISRRNNNTEELIDDVYKCLPNLNVTEEIWQTLIDRIYLKMIEKAVFFSDLGTWVTKNKAITCNVDCSPEQKQIIKTTIKDVLLKLQQPVVDVRQHMRVLVQKGNLRNIMPRELVTMIRNNPLSYLHLPWENKVALLNYFICDPRKEFQGLKLLQGLELLPLHCCHLTTFNREAEKVFVLRSEDVKLFIGAEQRFISQDLPDGLFKDLRSLASNNMFQLTTLNLEDMSLLLMNVFNTHCATSGNGKYIPKYKASPLNKVWIADVWKMINYYKNLTHINLTSKMATFDNIPLIPQLTADDTSIEHFCVLKGDYILKEYKGQGFSMSKPLPVDIIAMLEAENIEILKSNSIIDNAKIIGSYIKYPTDGGILELCEQQSGLKEKYVSHVGTGSMWQPTNINATPFGQREKLVTRLKNILDNYPKHHSVLKEILQNADDAGATEVHFLYDMRHHQTKYIFNDNWKPLQGPSLIVFNDAYFTANDLDGIKNLGIGSKTEEATKTGQFGIGFNAVYHITDVPTFMSAGKHAALGGMYCVLDPHCRYAPLARFNDPGMLMELQQLKERYSDVFDAFLTTGELKRENGTWFRFPFRNSEMAKTSHIRKTPFTSNDMKQLLEEMSCDMEESLLFLLNVKRITLSRVDHLGSHDILNIVDLLDPEVEHKTHLNFKKRFEEYNDLIIKQPTCDITSFVLEEFRYVYQIENFKSKESSTWLTVQTLGFNKPEMIDSRLVSSLKEKDIPAIIPRGGVAIKILPTSCTKEFKAKAFCLLPLNIETGLTCHVNGSFVLTCREISFGVLMQTFQAIDNSQYDFREYFKFLPDFKEAKNDFWKEFIYHFFLHSKLRRLKIFPVCPSISSRVDDMSNINEESETSSWTCLHIKGEMPILIDDLSNQIESDDACSLRSTCVELGMKLTCSPMFSDIRGRFEIQRFNQSEQVNQIRQVLKYCLKENKWAMLCGAPLLLNRMEEIFEIKESNELILTKFYYLLPKSPENFVHELLVDSFSMYRNHFTDLSIKIFTKLLPKTLESHTYKLDRPFRMVESCPRQWFRGFWKYIDSERFPLTNLLSWCLLPVNWNSTDYLFPLKMCSLTININSFDSHPELHSILAAMFLPTSDIESTVLQNLQAKYCDIETTLTCLYHWRKQINPDSKLSKDQCLIVLLYLIKDIRMNEYEKIRKLKDLPLFPTVYGDTVTVTEKSILIFDNKITIPTNGLGYLFQKLKLIVLQDFEDISVSFLYQLLGCERINAGTLYGNYILKHFNYISDESDRMLHLEFIRDNLLLDQSLELLLPSASIIFNGGRFRKANPFCNKRWRNFMISAGMKIQISDDIICRFAKRIAESGLQDDTYNRSKMIVKAFLNHVQTSKINVHYLSELSVIEFVAVEKTEDRYESIHPSYRTGLRLVSYSTAISHHCLNLAWTSDDILPRYAMPYNSKIRNHLNIREPSFQTIAQHAKNICLKLVKTCGDHDQDFIKVVLSALYDYFCKHLDKIDNLHCIPIVHVRKYKTFVRANQLIVDLVENDEIVPYLLKLPIEYGTYHELFTKLGMRTDPNINSYCKVLEQIYHHTRERHLSPKEIDYTKKAIQGLMKSLQNLESPLTELEVNVLYLLSEKNLLMPSDNLYYDSLEIPRESLKGNANLNFIAKLDCLGFNVAELPDLFSMLPEKHRPISIKSILTEKN
ncbi:SACS [Mytilus edulis]|uniref:SACS n=1 Tax=Mytilus edulis TaxID=6550 RepID=A0A8S3QPU6_MYTED|nr:SACS [Mytilus edulis]